MTDQDRLAALLRAGGYTPDQVSDILGGGCAEMDRTVAEALLAHIDREKAAAVAAAIHLACEKIRERGSSGSLADAVFGISVDFKAHDVYRDILSETRRNAIGEIYWHMFGHIGEFVWAPCERVEGSLSVIGDMFAARLATMLSEAREKALEEAAKRFDGHAAEYISREIRALKSGAREV